MLCNFCFKLSIKVTHSILQSKHYGVKKDKFYKLRVVGLSGCRVVVVVGLWCCHRCRVVVLSCCRVTGCGSEVTGWADPVNLVSG